MLLFVEWCQIYLEAETLQATNCQAAVTVSKAIMMLTPKMNIILFINGLSLIQY